MHGKTSTLTRSGPIIRSTPTVKSPLTVAAAEGFTATHKPKLWEQQPLKLSTRGHAPLQFAPAAPMPYKAGRPVTTLNDQEYSPLTGTVFTPLPVYWKLLEQPGSELDSIIHPLDDDPEDLPQEASLAE